MMLRKKKNTESYTEKLRADVLNSMTELFNGREMVLNAFKSGIFQVSKESQEGTGANEMSRVNVSERLKILTPNQMLKRLPIALAQVKQVIIQKVYLMKSGKT